MTATFPGITHDKPGASVLQVSALNSASNKKALSTLCQIFLSCMGRRLKVLHNNVGGHVTVTSSSGRLIQGLSSHSSFINLILSAVQAHVRSYSDGGLFTACLCLKLIENSMKIDIHRHLLTDIYEFLLQQSIDYIQSDEFPCKMKLEISNIHQMKSLVKSVIGTKPSCGLVGNDLDHIAYLLLNSVLRVYPRLGKTNYGTIQYLTVEGVPISQSKLYDGVLCPTPQIPVYRKRPLNFKMTKNDHNQEGILVAMFSTSLSGDSSDHAEARYDLSEEVDVDSVLLELLIQCTEQLLALKVGLVMCQKVIHPQIKKIFCDAGVLVLDRLGNKYITSVQKLTGCILMGSFNHKIQQDQLGWLHNIEHCVLHGNSYLHLINPDQSVCTLVLGNRSEESLQEMKYVCSAAEHLLKMTLSDPLVLTGGGCWQTCLVAHLKFKLQSELSVWSSDIGCSHHQLLLATKTFITSLEQVVMAEVIEAVHVTDSAHHHHWILHSNSNLQSDWFTDCQTCTCGMVSYHERNYYTCLTESGQMTEIQDVPQNPEKCQIFDSFPVVINGLSTAVSVACMILGIEHTIKDTN